jgi:hypothetical protein
VFASVGAEGALPKVNKLSAIHDAAKVVAAEAGFVGRDMPTLKYFSHDRSTVGVGVYQEIRGADENQYPLVFSARVNAETNEASIIKVGPGFCLPVSQHAMSARLDHCYSQATEFFTASDITKAVNTFLGKSHGVLLKQTGGVYFLPDEFIERYDALARGLREAGPVLHCWVHDLANNESLVQTLHDNMIGGILDRITERQNNWDALVSNEGKPQERGLRSRFDEMLADAATIEFYENFLSVRLDSLRSVLERQQGIIGMAHLDLWNAEEATV